MLYESNICGVVELSSRLNYNSFLLFYIAIFTHDRSKSRRNEVIFQALCRQGDSMLPKRLPPLMIIFIRRLMRNGAVMHECHVNDGSELIEPCIMALILGACFILHHDKAHYAKEDISWRHFISIILIIFWSYQTCYFKLWLFRDIGFSLYQVGITEVQCLKASITVAEYIAVSPVSPENYNWLNYKTSKCRLGATPTIVINGIDRQSSRYFGRWCRHWAISVAADRAAQF